MKVYHASDDSVLENASICPACVTTAPLCFCSDSCLRCGLPYIPNAYQGKNTEVCQCFKKHPLNAEHGVYSPPITLHNDKWQPTVSSRHRWFVILALVGALALVVALTAMANLPLK